MLISLFFFLAGCTAIKNPTKEAASSVDIRVTNRNWLAMDVYVVGQTRRVHLGRIPSGRTEHYPLPGDFLKSGQAIQFEMINANRTESTLTEEIVVVPGENIILVIPNER